MILNKIYFKTQLISLFFVISLTSLQTANNTYTASNWAEIACAALRGPLAGASNHTHGKNTKSAKAIHGAKNVVCLANEILFLINHPDHRDYISYFCAIFNASNLYADLFENNETVSTKDVDLPQEEKKKLNALVQILQTLLLPGVEGSAALYQAFNTSQSATDYSYRQKAGVVGSLAQATSNYLNNQDSTIAGILFLYSIMQAIYVCYQPTPPRNGINQNNDWNDWLNFHDQQANNGHQIHHGQNNTEHYQDEQRRHAWRQNQQRPTAGPFSWEVGSLNWE